MLSFQKSVFSISFDCMVIPIIPNLYFHDICFNCPQSLRFCSNQKQNKNHYLIFNHIFDTIYFYFFSKNVESRYLSIIVISSLKFKLHPIASQNPKLIRVKGSVDWNLHWLHLLKALFHPTRIEMISDRHFQTDFTPLRNKNRSFFFAPYNNNKNGKNNRRMHRYNKIKKMTKIWIALWRETFSDMHAIKNVIIPEWI